MPKEWASNQLVIKMNNKNKKRMLRISIFKRKKLKSRIKSRKRGIRFLTLKTRLIY